MKLAILLESIAFLYIYSHINDPVLALLSFLGVNLIPLGYLWIKYFRYFK